MSLDKPWSHTTTSLVLVWTLLVCARYNLSQREFSPSFIRCDNLTSCFFHSVAVSVVNFFFCWLPLLLSLTWNAKTYIPKMRYKSLFVFGCAYQIHLSTMHFIFKLFHAIVCAEVRSKYMLLHLIVTKRESVCDPMNEWMGVIHSINDFRITACALIRSPYTPSQS